MFSRHSLASSLSCVTSAPVTSSGVHPVTSWPAVATPVHSLSLPYCVIMWLETGVLESEQIPTSCNLFHNQDLYKYSVLPLPLCQIVISAQSIHDSSYLWLFKILLLCCACFPALHHLSSHCSYLSGSCFTSHHPTTVLWISLTTTTLDSPQDLFTLFYSANSNLSLHICFFCNSSELPRICTPYLPV